MTDIEFLLRMNDLMPSEPPPDFIDGFVEGNRLMPLGTPFPGLVDLRRTPYAREWMNNMALHSPIQYQAIMKSAQTAATFAVECIIGYWMKAVPAAIMYMSATDKLLEKWITKRFEPMIDSMGIRDRIISFAQESFSKRSRKTGDKMFSKQFIGGFFETASAQAAASQRSDSIRVLIRDETDAAPKNLSTGEGEWIETSEARTKMFGPRKKITDLSTPTTIEKSIIYPKYLEGDQRHYMVPCPLCGKMQFLYWLPEDGNHGLRGDTKAGKLIRAYYLCDNCHDAIFDTSKYEMLNAGKWEPKETSESKVKRSYYINSLYSPQGSVTWIDYYEKWLKAKNDPSKMRGFTNLQGGHPYAETGTRPKISKIIELRGTYKAGSIPNGVLFLTIGGDVQSGKKEHVDITDQQIKIFLADKNNNPQDLPRVELEILGIGGGYRTWSIDYKIFYGTVTDAYSGAWEKIFQWALNTQLKFFRNDGHTFTPELIFFDSGDGNITSTVYQFTGRGWKSCYPIKGTGFVNRKKNEKITTDEQSEFDFKRYAYSKIGDQYLYRISTNYYKINIYNNLKIKRITNPVQKPAFCNFPREYGLEGTPYHNYFKMLTAEEQLSNDSFSAANRRNEALDCRVYALCASDVWLAGQVEQLRQALRAKGATKYEVEVITTRDIINDLKVETGNQDFYKND